VDQVLVDGTLTYPGGRGRDWDDFLDRYVYGIQQQALKKGLGHDGF
jgi:hypothetical protein